MEDKKYHFIGIGGTGLSAIALVLLEMGLTVSGSDQNDSQQISSLREKGAEIVIGHNEANVRGVDVVIRSSAVPDQNIEVHTAQRYGIPVLKRVDFLPQLLQGKKVIAIAGTHGKSTTTAMIALLLEKLGHSPSYIIGSVSEDLGRNAHAGDGEFFIIEADEYDEMFLGINPYMAVVTSVEHDHPDLFPDEVDFHNAFIRFTKRINNGGYLLVCRSDNRTVRVLKNGYRKEIQLYSYGIGPGDIHKNGNKKNILGDYRAEGCLLNESGNYEFDFFSRNTSAHIKLAIPGLHNVENAIATLAVSDLLDLPLGDSAKVLEDYSGIKRRFEVFETAGDIIFINDYAHHPTEIRASLSAARAKFPDARIWALWQPHTYSRTQKFFDDFILAFDDSEKVIVTDIYPARETQPESGFSSEEIFKSMKLKHPDRLAAYFYIPELEDVSSFMVSHLVPGDVMIVLSAGDADQVIAQISEKQKSDELDE